MNPTAHIWPVSILQENEQDTQGGCMSTSCSCSSLESSLCQDMAFSGTLKLLNFLGAHFYAYDIPYVLHQPAIAVCIKKGIRNLP